MEIGKIFQTVIGGKEVLLKLVSIVDKPMDIALCLVAKHQLWLM
jgi:hypothetical protein